MTKDIQLDNFNRARFYKKYHDEIEIFHDFLLNKKVPEKIIEKLINAFIEADIIPTVENISFIQLKTGISLESLGFPASKYDPFKHAIAIKGNGTETLKVNKNKFLLPIDLSAKITWDKITIIFKNEYDIDIKVDEKIYEYDYEKMGFGDRRIKDSKLKIKTTGAWSLLRLLSINNGEYTLNKFDKNQKTVIKKQKQTLLKILKELFPNLSGSPFEDYDDIKSIYRLKIKLIPVKTFRPDFRDKDIREEKDDKLNDFDDYLEETTNMQDYQNKNKNRKAEY
jgi:hypothetical protein